MSFVFHDKEVYDQRLALRNAEEADPSSPLPIVSWLGKANYYQCPLGCRPGTGFLLMLRGDLDQLDLGDFHDLEIKQSLKMGDNDLSAEFTCQRMLALATDQCLVPSGRDDGLNLHLVPIVDFRHVLWNGPRFASIYNQRSNADGSYVPETTNGGMAWTWDQLLDDLWPSSAGARPPLPFQPHGIPEGLCFSEVSRWQAVQHVLDRIGCDVRYDPTTNIYDIVRLGSAGVGTTWDVLQKSLEDRRIWDDNPERGAFLPETIRVRFRVVPSCPDSTNITYVAITAHNDPDDPSVMPGTGVTLDDDAYAARAGFGVDISSQVGSGSATGSGAGSGCSGESFSLSFGLSFMFDNSNYLMDRATERVCDYMRIKRYYTLDESAVYSGLVDQDTTFSALGQFIERVSFEDRAATEDVEPGMRTAFGTGRLRDRRWEDWTWSLGRNCNESNPCGASGSGQGGSSGRTRVKIVTCVQVIASGSGSGIGIGTGTNPA